MDPIDPRRIRRLAVRDQARDVVRFYRDIAMDAPESVNLIAAWYWDDGKPYFGVEVCWSGDHAEGEAWLKPLRAFGKPALRQHRSRCPM